MKHDIREAFIHHVFGQFRQYCVEKAFSGNSANFLDFLLTLEMISEATIKHFVLLQEYRMMESQFLGKNKTERVQMLAQKYGLHPNTIWNVLKDHKDKFILTNEKF